MKREEQDKKKGQSESTPTETNDVTNSDNDYFVNINGEVVKVDVKNEEEYSCLLNCLEGYYIYGIGREDEDEDDYDEGHDDDNNDDVCVSGL